MNIMPISTAFVVGVMLGSGVSIASGTKQLVTVANNVGITVTDYQKLQNARSIQEKAIQDMVVELKKTKLL